MLREVIMAIEVKTKGNSLPNGKRRVYFSCHPEDFDKYFEEIYEDIFKIQDVAVYYTPDMKSEYDDEQLFELEQMSLFIIPVSYRLLSSNNRALDTDYKFATEKNIPILPIMLEESLNELYEAKFVKLEYIDKASVDITSISYEEKMKRFLNIVLISDKMAERIRAAFDAYIFLSYRKKDRRHANDLMKTIHLSPTCHDIAIWYDEFLVPGENFEDSILTMG